MVQNALLIAFYVGKNIEHSNKLFRSFKVSIEKAITNSYVMQAKDNSFNFDDIVVILYPLNYSFIIAGEADMNELIAAIKAADYSLIKDKNLTITKPLFSLLYDNMSLTEEKICGECSPCRLGGPRIKEFLKLFTNHNVVMGHLRQAGNVGRAMKQASMCSIGMFGADSLLFALEHFTAAFINAVRESAIKHDEAQYYASLGDLNDY